MRNDSIKKRLALITELAHNYITILTILINFNTRSNLDVSPKTINDPFVALFFNFHRSSNEVERNYEVLHAMSNTPQTEGLIHSTLALS